MKLDREQLYMMTAYAREEMQTRYKKTLYDSDVHLAKCWVDGLIRILSRDGMMLEVSSENQTETFEGYK